MVTGKVDVRNIVIDEDIYPDSDANEFEDETAEAGETFAEEEGEK